MYYRAELETQKPMSALPALVTYGAFFALGIAELVINWLS